MKNRDKAVINIAKKSLLVISFTSLVFSLQSCAEQKYSYQQKDYPLTVKGTQPLAMKGGDPYIRALMRTITASEANVKQPYHVIYGGSLATDLTNHPDTCITIKVGVNKGNCSTAAGRYQMLNYVWDEKAVRYHPNPDGVLWWKEYSFEPEYQDAVVYGWLKDNSAWGVNISELLKAGKIDSVLRLLSGTWTSLGYGIETNSMSRYLPNIYQNMLQEELNLS